MNLSEIKIPDIYHTTEPAGWKLEACRSYFRTHGKLDRELVIDENNMLMDGYVGYLVLRENGVKEFDVTPSPKQCGTYIAARHPGNKRDYFWRVTPRTQDADLLIPGLWALVNTKYGHRPVQITRIFSSPKSPVCKRMRGVTRALPEYIPAQEEGAVC